MTVQPSLRELIESAAESFEPPADGADRVLARLQEGRPARPAALGSTQPTTPRRSWAPALGAVSVLGVIALLVALTVGPHGGSSSSSSSSAGSVSSGVAAPEPPQLGLGTKAPFGPVGRGGTPAPSTQRMVQTAQLALTVPAGRVLATLDRLAAIASGLHGYVSQSRSDQSPASSGTGTVTIRVPVADYAAASEQVRAAGTVTSSSSQADDVTSQYVDLGARIDALQRTRATYLTLLSKATSIGDTLSVQQQVQDVQTQIEQLQGQQQVLADGSDLATVTVQVSQAAAATRPAPRHGSGFGAAFHSAVEGFSTGLRALIAISGPALLVLLVLLAALLVGRGSYRVVRRRML